MSLTPKHFEALARIVGQAEAAQALRQPFDLNLAIRGFCRETNPGFSPTAFCEAAEAEASRIVALAGVRK